MQTATIAPQTPTLPPFTALVAAWNEGENLEAHIRSFRALRWPGAQLVLCAGGEDGTYQRALALADEDVAVLEQKPGMGKQRALREALKHARHDLIFLTDADCLYDRPSLEALLKPLAEGRYQAATGGSRPLPRQAGSALAEYQGARDLRYFDQMGPEADGLLGRNAALTREALRQAGDLSEDVATGTDYHLAKKLREAGIKIAYVKESRVESEYPDTPASYLSRQRRWIKNLAVHDPRKNRPALFKSAALAALSLLGPLGLMFNLNGFTALLCAPFLLALASRYRDLIYAAKAGGAFDLKTYLAVPYFALLDQIAVLGALWDLQTPQRRTRW
ncbi:glycosyltransferase family 2 protein [Meiothermus sp. Pnk-1]|uniref:glycosyltransferase n=1 Tax=Meiothermus sp. Pnk-1 TaxID=873128 RepID=UPI000D7BB572|nr:glycosyltransferase family 2 protein [Meiothermus sp. Pnk-1]PZA06431.1 glycosyltransferase family 2 protein [Meiothermus sp. Pnk-1]